MKIRWIFENQVRQLVRVLISKIIEDIMNYDIRHTSTFQPKIAEYSLKQLFHVCSQDVCLLLLIRFVGEFDGYGIYFLAQSWYLWCEYALKQNRNEVSIKPSSLNQ